MATDISPGQKLVTTVKMLMMRSSVFDSSLHIGDIVAFFDSGDGGVYVSIPNIPDNVWI